MIAFFSDGRYMWNAKKSGKGILCAAMLLSNMTGIWAFAVKEIGQEIFLSAGLFGWEPEIANYEELLIKIEC